MFSKSRKSGAALLFLLLGVGAVAGIFTQMKPSFVRLRLGHVMIQNTLTFGAVIVGASLLGAPLAHAGQGGGYTSAGLQGEYFANPTFAGQPAFVRRDVRLDFSGAGSVGGSNTPEFKSFPTKNWGARWTGQLLPRFSESYTLAVKSNDAVRVYLKDPSSSTWKLVVDHWATKPEAVSTRSAAYPMTAGKPVDIKVAYRDLGGPVALRLSWKSASTPEETIDPVVGNALNVASYEGSLFADVTRTGRPAWENNLPLDEGGNPKGDGQYTVWEGGDVEHKGTYLVTFKGRANVWVNFDLAHFETDGKVQGSLPYGVGYDPKTNTTTARMLVTRDDAGILLFNIKDSQRSADAPKGSGITDLHIIRPLEPGSTTPQETGAIVNAAFKPAAQRYSALRYLGVANVHATGLWADRTLPTNRTFDSSKGDKSGGENWESLVMLANETGKDLYLTTPVNADNDYLQKLAQLLRYGSDGVNPYTAPQANPKYPPLNSNLCVYFEVGNEIWNWAFGSTQDANGLAEAEKKAGTPESKIFNYDGGGNYRTWHALRTVRASEIFRRVFGDAGFGTRFRPLLESQYGNIQDTSFQSFRFIDAYFNNGDGDHVPTPHPIGYYLWGAGSATYYGVGNNDGVQDEVKFKDASFEAASVPDGTEQKAPTGSGWNFKGDAGVYRLNSLAFAAQSLGNESHLDGGNALGMRFRVGAKPLFVKQFGRFAKPNSVLGDFSLLRADNNALVAKGSGGNIQPGWMQQWKDGFYYADAKAAQGDGPIRLEANTSYILVVTGGANSLQTRDDATVQAAPELKVEGGVSAQVSGDDASKWAFKDAATGAHSLGAVTFSYRTSDSKDLPALATIIDGQQAAILRGEGEFSQSVNFPKAGSFALLFHAAGGGQGWPGYEPFSIQCDDQNANPRGQGDYRSGADSVSIGGFARDIHSLREEWGSAVFTVKEPGPHTIRFSSNQKSDLWTAIDDLQITSVDAIIASGFGAGSAFGQVAQNNYQNQLNGQASFPKAFGLPVVAYEAGWSLGGDFGAKPIQTWTKFKDPRVREINNEAENIFARSGGYLNTWGVYAYWPADDLAHPEHFPLMQSLDDLNNRLPAEQTNGTPLPTTLAPSGSMNWGMGGNNWKGDFAKRGDWATWLVVAPKRGTYTLQLSATGDARYDLEADGRALVPTNGVYRVELGQGTHGIRVRSKSGTKWTLTDVKVG